MKSWKIKEGQKDIHADSVSPLKAFETLSWLFLIFIRLARPERDLSHYLQPLSGLCQLGFTSWKSENGC